MAMSAEITTDILMLMSTMTLRVAPKVTSKQMLWPLQHHLETKTDFDLIVDRYMNSPRADRMAADQKISPMSAGMKRRPPMRFPYICWNGSNMVT